MIRTSLLRGSRALSRHATHTSPPLARYTIQSFYVGISRPVPSFNRPSIRQYSAPAGLAKPEVEGRILDILKNFDKVQDASKLNGSSHFTNDLGLDSLDTVEVVMAIEEEFSIEIPDKEADAIHSVDKAVQYILTQPDAH